jgi:dihydropteroate synthase
MGVINLTPDSFSDGGSYSTPDAAWAQIDKLILHGAEVIDIGGESTRPGALPVQPAVQIERLGPILTRFKDRYSVGLSVDTTSSTVAEFALQSGADIINDISALRFEPELADHIAKWDGIVVLNHSRATPATMQSQPHYDDITSEIQSELSQSVTVAQAAGINKIIIDPGIGFGKTLDNNLETLRHLRRFDTLGYPIMVGTSRKSFIAKITGESDTTRLAGTISSTLWAINNGARILRVHDVEEVNKAVKVWQMIKGEL